MESLAALYKNHIVTLQERTRDALGASSWMRYLFTQANLLTSFSTIIRTRLRSIRNSKPGACHAGS